MSEAKKHHPGHGRTHQALTRHGSLLLATAFGAVCLTASAGCHRRPAGTCAEDVDCAPGFDCRAGVCARRERMRFGASSPGEVAPSLIDVADPAPDTSRNSASRDASAADAEGPVTPPPAHRPAPAVPKVPDVPAPPPPLPTPPPGGREPMWKQRLRNS